MKYQFHFTSVFSPSDLLFVLNGIEYSLLALDLQDN